MPTATTSLLGALGTFVAASRSDRAPLAVSARLRVQMASVLAAAMASREETTTRWASRATGPHPLLGSALGPLRRTTTARMEAIVGSIARVRADDWDDFALVGRTGAVAAVVPIVLGAPADLAWSEIESAQLVAVELAARAGIASVLCRRTGAQHGSNLGEEAHVVASVGAAAAAARVLGLDADAAAVAIARAFQHHGAYEQAGLAGVLAAELAFESYVAPSSIQLDVVPEAFASLGRAWVAETVHAKEHPAPACVQTAIDAAREIAAQGHSLLRRPLRATDVAHVELETTAFGASPRVREVLQRSVGRALGFDAPLEVRHAWELTSGLLWRAFGAFAPGPLLSRIDLRRVLSDLDVGAASLGHLASDLARMVARRAAIDPAVALRGLALPLATRITVRLAKGARLRAERTTPRGAPGAPIEEARQIVREKLRIAAGSRGRRIARLVLDPSPNQRVSDVLAAMAMV